MKKMNVQKEVKGGAKKASEETAGGRKIVPSTPVNICVAGGKIEGVFHGSQERETANGDKYRGHLIEATTGVGLDRDTEKAVGLQPGRYFVFSTARLDRLMREVMRGERVSIEYLGKVPNEKTDRNPEGEGSHHDYDVTVK